MKEIINQGLFVALCLVFTSTLNSCHDVAKAGEPEAKETANALTKSSEKDLSPLTKEFKSYWYAGNAEITSFELEQVRYGELRKGKAVQVFVTEPFLADKQVKADYGGSGSIPVLKLNSTKKFLTGIYPYSIMTSTFFPVTRAGHALKVSNSVQEWCGQVYTQLNNRDAFDIISHSYFEREADQTLSLEKTILEDELWNVIRLRPESLPVGSFDAIPSLEFLRLRHKEIRAYKVAAERSKAGGLSNYTLTYPELGRTLTISYRDAFPYTIEGWSESFSGGFGGNSEKLSSRARRIKRIKTAYWRQNANKDQVLRDSLGL